MMRRTWPPWRSRGPVEGNLDFYDYILFCAAAGTETWIATRTYSVGRGGGRLGIRWFLNLGDYEARRSLVYAMRVKAIP